ncbi:hypothetical protein HN014_22215 (plasmid) [Aquimarina sp. TRL1]|uniref:hypothetical protein n=1 Tax=Aquimarina sp. (strain TRL1) TaxID=2736252 RepID=UPI00158A1EC3|nr:hypothetical protein [Aquimarina sp. TRL1]QKX07717.1 hypothetical protein HN014_22215 [Aquimarina sp. TRL1]
MNNNRRKRIEIVKDKITSLLEELQSIQGEETEAFENLPESIQYSEKGEKMEEAADTLQNFIDTVESEIEELEEL